MRMVIGPTAASQIRQFNAWNDGYMIEDKKVSPVIAHIPSFINKLNEKYPEFDVTNWTPPTERNRICKLGYEYTNIKYNQGTKTFWYTMKAPNQRPSGPYHGRLFKDLLKMDELE